MSTFTNAQIEWATFRSPAGIDELRVENLTLRCLLWQFHGRGENIYHMLYGDDGEMSCNTCLLDFKRDPVDVIEERFKMLNVGRAALALEATDAK